MSQEMLQPLKAAERSMKCNDYAGARKQLLRASQIFPAINNIDSMIAVCEIMSAADAKLPGSGIDHYWVLQVAPSATFSEIRCQYQKLVTLLQPISRKFPCTNLALRHLLDAVTVLKDPRKRKEFNLIRDTSRKKCASFDVRASSSRGIPGIEKTNAAENPPGYKKDFPVQLCDGGSKPAQKLPEGVRHRAANQSNLCRRDKQHIENNLEGLNEFSANMKPGKNPQADTEMSMDAADLPTAFQHTSLERNSKLSSRFTMQKRPPQDFYNFEKERKSDHFKADKIWAVNYRKNWSHNYRYARIDVTTKAATFVTWLKPIPVTSGEKRWCDAGLPVACGSFEVSSEREMNIEVRWPMISSYECSCAFGARGEQIEIYPRKGEIWAVYKDWNLDDWPYDPDCIKSCKFELVVLSADFSKYLGTHGACLVKVDGFRSIFERQTVGGNPVNFHIPPDKLYIFSHKVPAYKFEGKEIDKVVKGMFELDLMALPDYMFQDVGTPNIEKSGISSRFAVNGQLPHFKSSPGDQVWRPSWGPNDFATGQIWAVYWGRDFMPRQYCQIRSLISRNEVCVTFLEPLPVLDHEIECRKKNLPIACGLFKVSEKNASLEMSQFCYLVKTKQSIGESCHTVYPLKSEVWAVYKGWNTNWRISDYNTSQCLIVLIRSDLTEGDSIKVSELGEVKGCLTFFRIQQHNGFDLIRVVSRSNLLSFSHQIPAFRVPGIGKFGIPESSWHLEPNALPPKCPI